MALTTDQQSQLELSDAMETTRHTNQMAIQAKQTKLEAIRLAKETLIENARSKPVDSREVTAADITAFANTLIASINA
jgi:hypothetical protein